MKNYLFGASLILFSIFFTSCGDDDDIEEPVITIPADVSPVVFNPAEVPYQTLSEYHFFSGNMKDFNPVKGVLPYDVITPLFSDYAKKTRFVWMPDSVTATYEDDYNVLNFPNGTILIKNFYYNLVQPLDDKFVIETRVMYMLNDKWEFAEYVWNENQTEAYLDMNGSNKAVNFVDDAGLSRTVDYRIPGESECYTCHKVNENAIPIGPKPQNINSDYGYSDGVKNQLIKWVQMGYLDDNYPTNIATVVKWDDVSQPLENRVRSYLDMNCAHCHRSGSHCDYREIRFAYNETVNTNLMGICMESQVFINSDLNYIIAGGKPEKSALLFRLNSVEEDIRMPLLGRSVVHEEGLQLIYEYIDSLGPC